MNVSFWKNKQVKKNDRILQAKVTVIQMILSSCRKLKSIHERQYTKTIHFYIYIRKEKST